MKLMETYNGYTRDRLEVENARLKEQLADLADKHVKQGEYLEDLQDQLADAKAQIKQLDRDRESERHTRIEAEANVARLEKNT